MTSSHEGFAWPRPPVEGYVAEDLDRLPGLPTHVELIDGAIVPRTWHSNFHQCAQTALMAGLETRAPQEGYRVRCNMSVVLSRRQRLEPDVILIRADAEIGLDDTWYPADAVVLAAEVVSLDSEIRDRERKPQLYAAAGIRYFWRAEKRAGVTVVFAYELDPVERRYVQLGVFPGRLRLSAPFPIDIDFAEIGRK